MKAETQMIEKAPKEALAEFGGYIYELAKYSSLTRNQVLHYLYYDRQKAFECEYQYFTAYQAYPFELANEDLQARIPTETEWRRGMLFAWKFRDFRREREREIWEAISRYRADIREYDPARLRLKFRAKYPHQYGGGINEFLRDYDGHGFSRVWISKVLHGKSGISHAANPKLQKFIKIVESFDVEINGQAD